MRLKIHHRVVHTFERGVFVRKTLGRRRDIKTGIAENNSDRGRFAYAVFRAHLFLEPFAVNLVICPRVAGGTKLRFPGLALRL